MVRRDSPINCFVVVVSGAPCRIPPHLLLLFPFDHPPPLHRRREPFSSSSSSAAFSIVCLPPPPVLSLPSFVGVLTAIHPAFHFSVSLSSLHGGDDDDVSPQKMLRKIIRRCSSRGGIFFGRLLWEQLHRFPARVVRAPSPSQTVILPFSFLLFLPFFSILGIRERGARTFAI